MPGPETALALDLHRQIEGAGEHSGDVARPLFNQLFQERLNRPALPSVQSPCSMVGLQLEISDNRGFG